MSFVISADQIIGDIHKNKGRIRLGERRQINYLPEYPFNIAESEQAMWRAVIAQAVVDALNREQKIYAEAARDEAVRWLTGGGEDFIDVCLRAGLEHSYVRACVKKVLTGPWSWRPGPGQSARYFERRVMRERLRRQRRRMLAAPVSNRAQGCVIFNLFSTRNPL